MSRIDRDRDISYRNLFKTMAQGVVYQDAEGKIISANQAAEKILGLTFDQMTGRTSMDPLWKAIHEDGSDFSGEAHPAIIALKTGKKVKDVTMGVFNPENETYRWININAVPEFREGEQKPYQVYTIFEDITKRKHDEKSMRESEERYRQIFNIAPAGIYEVDYRTGKLVSVNDTICEYSGYTKDELLSMSALDLLTEDSQARFLTRADRILRGKSVPDTVEYDARRKDGSNFIVSINTKFVYEGEEIVGATVVAIDITDRKKAEAALQESEGRFRTLVEKSPLGISLIGRDGCYKYLNPRFEEIFGYTIDDIPTGKEWFRKAYPDETYRQQIVRVWAEDKNKISVGRYRPQKYTVTCKDGSRKEIHFRPVTLENHDQFVIYEDITERSRLEKQLQQAQKFEAIGTLAGGIAHDFNNILMGIQGRASLMSVEHNVSQLQREHIQAIEEYVRGAANLTRQLLGFAQGGKYEVRPVDLNELLLSSAALFGRTRKEIQIQTKTPPAPLVIEADKRQIEQVLLNIFINAWQAMPNGGELYLETSTVRLAEETCMAHGINPGDYGKISVTDTGIGMDDATRQQIFDPFFTTKSKGRGTGLGLASTYGIIQNHGGMITVYSEPGRGTTFELYLPISVKEASQEPAEEKKMITGSETILLVDDEELIIDVGKKMLEILGYHAVVATSGEQAVKVISEKVDEIDLVILDMIMPGMDGGKTFERIHEIQPELPVILSSGYSIKGQATDIIGRGCSGFIQKPFSITELSQKVREILDDTKNSLPPKRPI